MPNLPALEPSGSALIPLRTHVITPGEDLAEAARRYTRRLARPGDVLAVAESPVAIAQGRIYLEEEVRPGLLARVACHFTGKEGSLTSPETMQLAIRVAGGARVLLGCILAAVGRLTRKRGLFFRAVGPEVKLIDDVSGTMPPFERYIVLGPASADELAARMSERAGLPVLIVDANDLGKVDLVGISPGFDPELRRSCLRALESNPFGNGYEQTPMVLIRPAPTAAGPADLERPA